MNKSFRILVILGVLVAHTMQVIGQDKREEEIQTALIELKKFGEVAFVIKLKDAGSVNQLSSQISIAKLDKYELNGFVNRKQFTEFLKTGIPFEVVPHTPLTRLPDHQRKSMSEWTTYPYLSEYDSIMKKFESDNPDICLLDTIGYSVDGKPLLMLKISDNVSLHEAEPNFLYTSSMHGNETGGFILMLRLADYILDNYCIDQRINDMVDNLQIWINPLANPDGFYRSYDSLYIPVRSNSNGVDLNRNFPDPGNGPHPDGNQYQPETIAMMEFMKDFPQTMSANFHSGTEVLNYPWDTWYTRHADDLWFQYISHEYADTAQEYSTNYMTGYNDGITNGYDWYSIWGGRQDYVTYFLGGREVTIEIDDPFVTPEAELENLWQYNYRSLLNYLEQAQYGIRGTVKDSITDEPLKVKIEVVGHDSDSSHIYSDSLRGDYYRLIYEGTYHLQFSAPGYQNKTIEEVQVFNYEVTYLDVRMVPLNSSGNQILLAPDISYYPNPFQDILTVSLQLNQPAHLEFQIYDILGKKRMIPHSSVHSGGEILINLDMTTIPSGIYVIRSVIGKSVVDQRIIKKK